MNASDLTKIGLGVLLILGLSLNRASAQHMQGYPNNFVPIGVNQNGYAADQQINQSGPASLAHSNHVNQSQVSENEVYVDPWSDYYSEQVYSQQAGHLRRPLQSFKSNRLVRKPSGTDNTPMRLKLQTDVLFLSRTGAGDDFFLFDNLTNAPVLRHSDLEFGDESALRYKVLFQSAGGTGYEFSYFDMDGFNSDTTHGGVYPLMFGGIPANFFPGYDVVYDATLKNYELNTWVRKNNWLRWGVGLRHTDLRENFDTIETGSRTAGSGGTGFFSDTDNDLFGVQGLLELRYQLLPGVQIEAGVKIGGYHNNIDVRLDTENRDLHYEDEAFSTVTDFNIGVALFVTQQIDLRFGYQSMVLSDVALAPNQSAGFNFFQDSAPAKVEELTFDGGYVGIEMRF